MKTDVVDLKRAQRELIVNEHIEAKRHDIPAAVKTFKHPRYEVPALGVVADGAEAVYGLLGALLAAFPDFHAKFLRSSLNSGGRSAEHRHPLFSLQVSGPKILHVIRFQSIKLFDHQRRGVAERPQRLDIFRCNRQP